MKNIISFFNELKRRKVFRSSAIYGGASFVILQVCSIIFPALLLPEWSIRLLVVLLMIGFPLVLIFSWIYDVTDGGIVKTKTVEKSNNNYFTALLLIILASFAFYIFKDQIVVPSVNPKSIAVIPFDNYSPSSEDEYLSAGFTEVIIANLAKVKDLMVISRTSVMRYKNTTMSLKDIAKELNVAHILEGSIQRTGDKIRVVGQLIEASSDKHVWAETYDAEFENIFTIQTEIATSIASALKSQITDSEKENIKDKKTDSIEAYEMYLKVRDLKRRSRNFMKNRSVRMDLLNKIIEIDPLFAEAYSQISLEYSDAVQFGVSGDSEEDTKQAKFYIEKAFDLKPDSPDVRNAYGWYYYSCYRDYEKALKHYKVALSQEPGNSETHARIGFAYRRLGNEDESISYVEKSRKLDPNHFTLFTNLYGSYLFFKKYDKIDLVKYDKDYFRIDPTNPGLYGNRAELAWWLEGDTDYARKIIDSASAKFAEYDFYSDIGWQLDIYDRNYEPVLNHFLEQGEWIMPSQQWVLTNYHPLSIMYWLMGDEGEQQVSANKGVDMMQNELMEGNLVRDSRFHSSLAYVYAFAGKKEDALREVNTAISLMPSSKDIMLSDHYIADRAIILAIVGEHDKSLDIFDELLSGPSNYFWAKLKYHYILHNIFKDNERFNSIVGKDEVRYRKNVKYDHSIYFE